jgi:membrane-associated phospholipid phosphatase
MVGSAASKIIGEMNTLDRAVYRADAESATPTLDEPLRRLSDFANYSKIWILAAAIIGVTGGKQGRRAAVFGMVSIGVTSAVVNQGVKRLATRPRPDREAEGVQEPRFVHMPESTSFPSGHSASAFAFATTVGGYLPVVGVFLRFLAAAVAYSRVHTGVHYPGDVVIGSLIGGGIGGIVSRTARQTDW